MSKIESYTNNKKSCSQVSPSNFLTNFEESSLHIRKLVNCSCLVTCDKIDSSMTPCHLFVSCSVNEICGRTKVTSYIYKYMRITNNLTRTEQKLKIFISYYNWMESKHLKLLTFDVRVRSSSICTLVQVIIFKFNIIARHHGQHR